MLDDVGFAPIAIMVLVFFSVFIVGILASLGLTLILKRLLEKRDGRKRGSGFVIPVTLVIFVLLYFLLYLTSNYIPI